LMVSGHNSVNSPGVQLSIPQTTVKPLSVPAI